MFGHHRAACAVAGVLGKRGFPLECGSTGVPRGRARVSTNIPVREMDLAAHHAHHNLDGRRLEVVADGLTLWHGAQLAIDATLVSPLRRDGSARFRAADQDGAVLMEARRRKKEPIPNYRERVGGLDWWSSLRKWAAGGVTKRPSLVALANAKAQASPFILQNRVKAAYLRKWSARMLGGQSVHNFLVGPAPRVWLGRRRAFSA